jgi:hypothetical protein
MDTQERLFVADRRVQDTLDDIRREELVRAARAQRDGRYTDARGAGLGALVDRLGTFLAGGAAGSGRPAMGSLA